VTRVLVTFATGPFAELLDIARPGFEEYADRHGYELRTAPPAMLTRPASWGKVSRLLDALDVYSEALWIDCDVVMLDTSVDLADEVPPEAWHAITMLHTREGEIPSCGVWLCRQAMRRPLEQIWSLTRYLHHPWWEQAALHHALGYGGQPVALQNPTELLARTYWLGGEWNALRLQFPDPETEEFDEPRFAHCGPGSSVGFRAGLMRDLTARAELAHTTEGA